MTLIIGAVTPQYVVLISDRRITVSQPDSSAPGGRKIISQKDTDTKSILLDRRYVMGFGGLARIGPNLERMESWAATALNGIAPDDYFDTLADKLGTAFEAQGATGPHAFLAVGFKSTSDGAAGDPEIVTITNSADSDGNFVRDSSPTWPFEFRVYRTPLSGARFLCRDVGWEMPPGLMNRIQRELKIETRRRPDRPDVLFDELLRALRGTARESHGYVGTEALVTSIPRVGVPIGPPAFMIGDEPPSTKLFRTEHMSISVPANDRVDDGERFHPAFISPDITMAGIQIGRQEPGPLEGMFPLTPEELEELAKKAGP